MAAEAITILPAGFQSTKMLVLEAVRVLHEIEFSITSILARMQTLALSLPEFRVLGNILAVRLIAEIGDIRRFWNVKTLIAYAGFRYRISREHIPKLGSLRKTGYEIINSILKLKPDTDKAVYIYTLKKEAEGKPKKSPN